MGRFTNSPESIGHRPWSTDPISVSCHWNGTAWNGMACQPVLATLAIALLFVLKWCDVACHAMAFPFPYVGAATTDLGANALNYFESVANDVAIATSGLVVTNTPPSATLTLINWLYWLFDVMFSANAVLVYVRSHGIGTFVVEASMQFVTTYCLFVFVFVFLLVLLSTG